MDKKGFTLIELLAVIIILAIITIIAVPKILDVIESSRRSAFESSIKLIEDSIKTQTAVDGIIKNNNIIIKKVYADTVFEKDVDGAYEFDFTLKNSNYQKLNIRNKEKFTGKIIYKNNKFEYIKFGNGKYKVNTDGNGNKIITKIAKGKIMVTFISNGSEYESKEIKTGEKVTLPEENPSKSGYMFRYWSLTEDGYEFDTNIEITDDTALYAVFWQPVCKRATTLHSDGTHTFGNNPSTRVSGTLTSGDAFDCDVTGTGQWERFYYVSDYYNTSTKSFNNTIAILIYYNNTTNGLADNTSANLIKYNSDPKNYEGPKTGYTNLPSTSQWSNSKIIAPGTREIINENGLKYGSNETQPFTYTNKAARLLTTQELNVACNITVGSETVGELDSCIYLLENTSYSTGNSLYGIWLETNDYSRGVTDAWAIVGSNRYVSKKVSVTAGGSYYAVRPVIEVLKSDMSY